MYHEVTDGLDPICNKRLPMVGTLFVTRDPMCNGTLLLQIRKFAL